MLKLIRSVTKYKKYINVLLDTFQALELSIENHFADGSSSSDENVVID